MSVLDRSGSRPAHPEEEGVYSTGRARAVVAADAIFMALATAAVIARIVSRRMKGRVFLWNELLLGLALLFLYGLLISDILRVPRGGLGHHLTSVSRSQLQAGVKVTMAAQCLYVATIGVTRTAICIAIARLAIPRSYRRMVTVLLVLNALWLIYGILSTILRCVPISDQWHDPTYTASPTCANSEITLAVSFACSLALSLSLWTLAVFAARHIFIHFLTRCGLALLFVIALLGIIIGVVAAATKLTADLVDYTWTVASPVIWQSLEPTLAVVVVALMSCRPLWDHVLHVPPGVAEPSSVTGSSSEGRSSKKGGTGRDSYGRLKDEHGGVEMVPGSTTTAAGGRHQGRRTPSGFITDGLHDNRARRDRMLSGNSTDPNVSRNRDDLESGVFVRQEITVSAENRL